MAVAATLISRAYVLWALVVVLNALHFETRIHSKADVMSQVSFQEVFIVI
jgi:hypothetical protein